MICNRLWLGLYGFLACFAVGIVAREAMIGGIIAEANQFAYHVSLQIDQHHICGGGILGDEYILTAAHCIVDNLEYLRNRLSILAGTNNLLDHGSNAVRIPVFKAFVLKEYNKTEIISNGDIAVLKLKHPLSLTPHGALQRARLPKNQRENYVNKSGKIAGFGWVWKAGSGPHKQGNNTDGRLRFTVADVIDNELLGDEINEKHLIAKARQNVRSIPTGTCPGDSGGLLVDDEKYIMGILSIGPDNCAEDVDPAIYTRVSGYLTFIRKAKEDKKTRNMHEYVLSD